VTSAIHNAPVNLAYARIIIALRRCVGLTIADKTS